MTSTQDRFDYIAGLRALADVLEQHEGLPLPDSPGIRSGQARVAWYLFGGVEPLELEQQKTLAADIVRTLPGRFDKEETGELFRFRGRIEGLPIEVIVDRPAVCERVVIATREVTREVVVPVETRVETVTETVEDIEWRCQPLLAPAQQASA